ncbi:DUF2398 family protein [Streptosporangium sp. NPDC006013]|uniref:DUF2398 family protein n=1 Tax=Streptosporangium sp. NPDC006013 TaxID=3155596 RepID=UPI0033AA8B01
MSGPLLEPDLRDAARALIATIRIRAEIDQERYRAAVRGRQELTAFFRDELGWIVEVNEVAELVRLHKRRVDVPADRGPFLVRERGKGPLAPREVLVCVALICEQLWRRSRMSLQELLQAVAQVCAAEAAEGTLPHFQVVAPDGIGKRHARQNRQTLVDALKLLVAEGTITVDADLDRTAADDSSDLVVSASRDRLAIKFSSLSPILLGLGELPPDRHAAALSSGSLPEQAEPVTPQEPPSLEDRRLRLIRRLADDPATDPMDDLTAGLAYLHTLTGRERALNVMDSLGFHTTVRRDWWEVTDPTAIGTNTDFPNGRKTERQAALALLAMLSRRENPIRTLVLHDAIKILEEARTALPRWAAAYEGRLPALVQAAATELVAVGLLRSDPDQPDTWHATPGVHLWRVRVRHGQGKKARTDADQEQLPLLDLDDGSTS